MVVTGAGLAHAVIAGAGPRAHMSGARRHRDQRLDGVGHVRVSANAKYLNRPCFRLITSPLASSNDRCVLAVDGVILASRESSFAVSAMPDINAISIFARAGSPIIAATLEISGPSFIV